VTSGRSLRKLRTASDSASLATLQRACNGDGRSASAANCFQLWGFVAKMDSPWGEAAGVHFEDGFRRVGDVLGHFLRLGEPIQPRRGRGLQGKSELGGIFFFCSKRATTENFARTTLGLTSMT
jgi:hypothetical protein